VVVELVESGRIAEARIDESARRLLRDKFRLGLFDNPFVDPTRPSASVRRTRSSRRPGAPSGERPC
jgi:Beta-glucosidase-related glycosidases